LVPGVARYQGCPVPDVDKDGVNDEDDKCPNEPGPASNFGCPLIKTEVIAKLNAAAAGISFYPGTEKFSPKSNTALAAVLKILQDDPTYKVDISVYTDNKGSAEKNLMLSQNQANAIKSFLMSKGIDESRINAKGFGADKKRVEMTLHNY